MRLFFLIVLTIVNTYFINMLLNSYTHLLSESLEHRSCKVSSDCPLTNSICPLTSKICKCDMEYKYDSDKNKCVKECDHYGDEFTLYDNVRITKLGNIQYVNTQVCITLLIYWNNYIYLLSLLNLNTVEPLYQFTLGTQQHFLNCLWRIRCV